MMDPDFARDQDRIDEEAAQWFARRLDRNEGPGRHLTDVTEEQAFEAWIQADPRHRAAYQFMEQTADDITWVHPQSGYQPKASRARTPTRVWPKIAAAVAGIALLAGAGLYAASALNGIHTDVGETRTLTLSDGTQVTLSGKSSIAVHFTGRQRQVVLNYGEAYFDVVHNAQRPFSVIAGGTEVRDVGTQFNVNMRQASLEISVLAGEVSVNHPGEKAQPLLDAHAGQRVRVTLAAARTPVAAPNHMSELSPLAPQAAVAIREGRQSYDQTRLGDIVDDINRYYAPGISLSDPRAGDQRLTASFMPKDVNAFIAGLPEIANLTVSQSDDGHVVISSRPATTSAKTGPA